MVRGATREAIQKRCAAFAVLAFLFLALGILWVLLERPALGWGKVGCACLLAVAAGWSAMAIRWLDRHRAWL